MKRNRRSQKMIPTVTKSQDVPNNSKHVITLTCGTSRKRKSDKEQELTLKRLIAKLKKPKVLSQTRNEYNESK